MEAVQEGTEGAPSESNTQEMPDETTLRFVRPEAVETTGVSAGTGTFMLFLRMVVVLALVVASIYLISRLLRRAINPAMPPDAYMKKVSSVTLAPGKTVHVITVGTQAFVVGAAENGVSLIGELTDRELIDAMNLHGGAEVSGKPKDFASLLAALLPGVRQGTAGRQQSAGNYQNRDDFSVSAGETTEYLRRQRERLRDGADSERGGSGRDDSDKDEQSDSRGRS